MEPKQETSIIKITGNSAEGVIDEVASELPVSIVLNGGAFVTLLCTPSELGELAVGFLLSEGILRTKSSLKKIEASEKDLSVAVEITDLPKDPGKAFSTRTISSGCGRGVTFTHVRTGQDRRIESKGPVLAVQAVRDLLRDFRNISTLYLETGGVHSAALSDGIGILFFSEDIGRHNAVDKLIGKAFLKDVSLENKVLVTSGRVTSEIITKAARNRIPVVISRAAPSCMAVSLAEDMGITLIGFARGERMNVYSWPNRIKV